jgi:hypothetical protein
VPQQERRRDFPLRSYNSPLAAEIIPILGHIPRVQITNLISTATVLYATFVLSRDQVLGPFEFVISAHALP